MDSKEEISVTEKDVLILVIKNDTLEEKVPKFKQTTDFLIIQSKHKIFFKKFALISDAVERRKANIEKIIFSSAGDTKDNPSEKKGEF